MAWLAQKDEQRRQQEAAAAKKKRAARLPDWYLNTAVLRPQIDSEDFAAW